MYQYVHVSGPMSLLLLASVWQGTSGQPCERGTMYQKGKCLTCDHCFAGSELNYTNFDKSLEMGYLSCPPCSPCPEESYREPNEIVYTCKKCSKNCTADNKMWKTRCGNTSQGDCGNCMDGYVQNSSDSNSPCIKRTLIDEDNNDVLIIVGIVIAVVVILVITGAVSFCFVCRGESDQRCYKGRTTVTDGLDEAGKPS